MPDFMQNQSARFPKTAIILDDDMNASAALRHMLQALGYETQALVDAHVALDTLRASIEPVALFFDVEAYGETLDGRGYASLIGALLAEPALARKHIFAITSSTADDVEWALGKVLDRLDMPVFSKPYDAFTIESYLALAREPMAQSMAEFTPTI